MKQLETQECLQRKLTILEKIEAKTETQSRFIAKRDMRGLKRILRERAALLTELAEINQQLELDSKDKSAELNSLVKTIAAKAQQVLQRSEQVLQQAKLEREKIGNELKSIRNKRRLMKQYLGKWQLCLRGKRFSAKG